jgi:hypothetical protein
VRNYKFESDIQHINSMLEKVINSLRQNSTMLEKAINNLRQNSTLYFVCLKLHWSTILHMYGEVFVKGFTWLYIDSDSLSYLGTTLGLIEVIIHSRISHALHMHDLAYIDFMLNGQNSWNMRHSCLNSW